MGDSRRFYLFSQMIKKHIPLHSKIIDVAGGKGYLKAELYRLGYKDVTTWDKRRNLGKQRMGYRYGYFDYKTSASEYNTVVAMHPDEATDHCILYGAKHRIPVIICPCCVKPSAVNFDGRRDKRSWLNHLSGLATNNKMSVIKTELPMKGDNIVLICKPL